MPFPFITVTMKVYLPFFKNLLFPFHYKKYCFCNPEASSLEISKRRFLSGVPFVNSMNK
jgi:hypothetical protein